MPRTASSRTLTIHLGKEGCERSALIKDCGAAKQKQVPIGKATMGTLLIEPSAAKPPS